MKSIEDDFQQLSVDILNGADIGVDEKDTIDRFFSLWRRRFEFAEKPLEEVMLQGVSGDKLSPDQEELLEAKGVYFIREGGRIQAHRMHGIELQVAVDYDCLALSNIHWGVVRASAGQFLVPECPFCHYVPLSPAVCIMGAEKQWPACPTMGRANVVAINHSLKDHCASHYFANDISTAPSAHEQCT